MNGKFRLSIQNYRICLAYSRSDSAMIPAKVYAKLCGLKICCKTFKKASEILIRKEQTLPGQIY